MKLTFHAIVHLGYWEWDNTSRIHIRFGHEKLGSWEVDCGKFQIARYIEYVLSMLTCYTVTILTIQKN